MARALRLAARGSYAAHPNPMVGCVVVRDGERVLSLARPLDEQVTLKVVADDDDGDLSNGTPHAAELYAAFKRHEIACGLASAPENQSTSSCPSLAAPVLTVTETGSGTELGWDAVSGAAE